MNANNNICYNLLELKQQKSVNEAVMLKEQRLQNILQRVNREKAVTIHTLSQNLGVSYMTIWRDLTEMEEQGLLQRVRGGALAVDTGAYPSPEIYPGFDTQQDVNYEKKVHIARYAADHLVSDGENITIEAGTTASSLVNYLHHSELTILTNGLAATMMAVQHLPDTMVMCSGGILIETGAFIGPQAEDFFRQFRVNKAFLSAQGFTLEDGFTDHSPLYSQLKSAMIKNAGQVIMLVDSSKWGYRSLIRVMGLEEVDVIVTDSGAPREIIDGLLRQGIDVRVSETG